MAGQFKANVAACAALRAHYKPGLQAIPPVDSQRLLYKHPKHLTGSVNVESAMVTTLPNANLWDYGIGYEPAGRGAEVVHWVEVHPANDGEVKVMEAKLDWLVGWLRRNAPGLSEMERRFVWVSSGSTSLTPFAPARRRLAQRGLRIAGHAYSLDQL